MPKITCQPVTRLFLQILHILTPTGSRKKRDLQPREKSEENNRQNNIKKRLHVTSLFYLIFTFGYGRVANSNFIFHRENTL